MFQNVVEAGRDERYCERHATGTIATRAQQFNGYDGAWELELLQQRAHMSGATRAWELGMMGHGNYCCNKGCGNKVRCACWVQWERACTAVLQHGNDVTL